MGESPARRLRRCLFLRAEPAAPVAAHGEPCLHDASEEKVGEERHPQGVVAPCGLEAVVQEEESRCGCGHGAQHDAGGRGADADAV